MSSLKFKNAFHHFSKPISETPLSTECNIKVDQFNNRVLSMLSLVPCRKEAQ